METKEIFDEIALFVSSIKRIAVVTVAFFLVFFLTDPFTMKLGLTTSFSVTVFRYIAHITSLKIITISPFEAILTDMKVAGMLALIFSMPYISYELIRFAFPGLTIKEKKFVKLVLFPATVLFIAGMAFAWFIIVPALFYFTAILDSAMGIIPTVSAASYTTTILSIMISLGLSFEIPIIIGGLTFLNIIHYEQLVHNWRYGIAGSWILALFISPGATGGMMETVIGSILSGLFVVGLLISRTVETRRVVNASAI